MDGKGANSNSVKYEDDVEKKPAETPENNLLPSEDPKEKKVEEIEYADLQFDDNLELSPQPPLSSSDEMTYVKV
ncbi:hypothetical protein NP493_127g02000 [Ridgeia piscesae]|uniref:Uncharacterized protein n=1 Tax=Ridgeia piscesae TaxID=27915 RepID=A0AAD9P5M6_RIDPI|nr:hypothetical protein NP493_127g02000 [Ridgeia piscesae]